MAYQGVKYRTEMIGTDIPSDPRLSQLKQWCSLFHENDFAPLYDGGSFGNLSMRTAEGFIITASNTGLDAIADDGFVLVKKIEDGVVYAYGQKTPSSEAMVHKAIYDARPEVNAVFHGHCEEISRNAKKLGIPITSREEPYGTQALVDRVLETLGQNNFLEMRNHGFISLGKTLDEAGNLTFHYSQGQIY